MVRVEFGNFGGESANLKSPAQTGQLQTPSRPPSKAFAQNPTHSPPPEIFSPRSHAGFGSPIAPAKTSLGPPPRDPTSKWTSRQTDSDQPKQVLASGTTNST